MDLDEWIFLEKRKRPGFSNRVLANELGVTAQTISKLLHNKRSPSSKLAYLIEKYTDGKVSAWELIRRNLDKNEYIKKEEN